jgi:hypothetical protein
MTYVKKATLLTAALAGLAWPVAAQQQGQPGRMMGQGSMMTEPGMMHGPGMMMQMPMMQGMGPGGMGPMMGGPGQHIEGRIAFLKAELGITPEQEQVWSTYADALRASASSMQGMHDQMMSGGGMPATLPERMQWHEQMMSSRLEALKTIQAAAVPLYNALKPEQKQTADTLMMGMGMM